MNFFLLIYLNIKYFEKFIKNSKKYLIFLEINKLKE